EWRFHIVHATERRADAHGGELERRRATAVRRESGAGCFVRRNRRSSSAEWKPELQSAEPPVSCAWFAFERLNHFGAGRRGGNRTAVCRIQRKRGSGAQAIPAIPVDYAIIG